jgi:nitrogen regulatory protein PII-like uncharacterized protein
MQMVLIINWLSTDEINVVHQYRPQKNTAWKHYKTIIKSNGPLMYVYKSDNKYFLWKGVFAYNSLSSLFPQKKVPCYVIPYTISTLEWQEQFLLMSSIEKAHHVIRQETVAAILQNTDNDTKKIAAILNKSEEEVNFEYITHPDIPINHKKIIIDKNRIKLVNSFYTDPLLIPYQSLLLESVIQENKRLTYEKLDYFRFFIQLGFNLKTIDFSIDEQLAEFSRIVDKKEAWRIYWRQLYE